MKCVLGLEDERLVVFEIVEKAILDEISLDGTELIDLYEVEDEDEEIEALRLDVESAFFVEVEDNLGVVVLVLATLDLVVLVLDFKLVEGGTAVELFDEMEDFFEVPDVVVEVFWVVVDTFDVADAFEEDNELLELVERVVE